MKLNRGPEITFEGILFTRDEEETLLLEVCFFLKQWLHRVLRRNTVLDVLRD